MGKYEKIPVEVDAKQFTKKTKDKVFDFVNASCQCRPEHRDGESVLVIETLHGLEMAALGDWIIREVDGEFLVYKPETFEKTYRKVKKPKKTKG